MIDSLDALLARIWRKPLVLLCRASGKSNFFWAKFALAIAAQAGILQFGIFALGGAWLHAFIMIWWVPPILMITYFDIKLFEQWGDPTILPLCLCTHPKSARLRIILVLMVITVIPLIIMSAREPVMLLLTLPMLLLPLGVVSALYWVLDKQPPAKSLFARASDWLRAHRPHLNLDGHNPYPVPG